MARIIRCDRCRKETVYARSITLPLWWYNETDEEVEFDLKTIDLCFDCSEALKVWYKNVQSK